MSGESLEISTLLLLKCLISIKNKKVPYQKTFITEVMEVFYNNIYVFLNDDELYYSINLTHYVVSCERMFWRW